VHSPQLAVLFVPGNAGSPRQVRSLAAETLRRMNGKTHGVRFYALGFDEQLSGVHGALLWQQAEYVNRAIATLLRCSAQVDSVVVVGHSMGGVVARAALTISSYVPGSVRTLITLNSPHRYAGRKSDIEKGQWE
jgi:GPI inositol-deacylase